MGKIKKPKATFDLGRFVDEKPLLTPEQWSELEDITRSRYKDDEVNRLKGVPFDAAQAEAEYTEHLTRWKRPQINRGLELQALMGRALFRQYELIEFWCKKNNIPDAPLILAIIRMAWQNGIESGISASNKSRGNRGGKTADQRQSELVAAYSSFTSKDKGKGVASRALAQQGQIPLKTTTIRRKLRGL